MDLISNISEADHSWGNPDAPIILVEYGDFQCPHCGRAFPIVKRIKEQMSEQVKVVYRHFPLSKIHPHAKPAAVAAEAADRQGEFWRMHDMIFEHQKWLNNNSLLEYANTLGLVPDQFTDDLGDPELFKKVENDFMSGLRSGVNATPCFFINGVHFTESWEEDGLEQYLLALLNSR
jgi:protein-disulfide isomerase